MQIRRLQLLLSLTVSSASCSYTVQDLFIASRYSYPLYIERKRGVPMVRDHEGKCVEGPDHREFYEAALAALSEDELGRLMRRVCPAAEAAALLHPFVYFEYSGHDADGAASRASEPRLAMRMECYGKDSIKPGLTFEQARGGIETMVGRREWSDRAVDNWQVEPLNDSIWHMWNVAFFEFADARLSFDSFFYEHDPQDHLAYGITPEDDTPRAPICIRAR
jgi:hypothetical protein